VSSRAHETLWPGVCAWFAERDTHGTDLQAIAGIGPAYAERLQGAEIATAEELAAADPAATAEAIDVSPDRVTEWVDHAADLTA